MQSSSRKARRTSTQQRWESFQDLVYSGSVTRRGLTEIIQRLKSTPTLLESGSSRATVNRALASAFLEVRHVLQLPLQAESEPFMWELCEPNRLISYMVNSCPRLADAFLQTARTHPTPWHIVVAFDEYDSGDPTQHEHSRKLMALNFSFLELGKERLWSEDYWFTPILVRTDYISKVVGGWSAMLRAFLNLFLIGPTGISTAGVPLNLDGEPFLLFAELSHVLADGDGLRQGFQWIGANGIKPCLRHWNVLKLDTDLATRDPGFVEIDCASPDRFRLATTANVHDIAETLVAMEARVAAGLATMAKLKQLRMACGFVCSAAGLLADRNLGVDIINAARYDWMHTTLQDGVLVTEAALLVAACVARLGMTLDDLKNNFRGQWCFPRQHQAKGNRLWLIFVDRRIAASKIKASASEMIQLYGLLRNFFEQHVGARPEVRNELEAFQAACRCVDILLNAKRGRIAMTDAADLLASSLRQLLLLHIRAHGKDYLKPKFHWLWDIVDQLRRDPFVLDCWVVERLNKRAKAASQQVDFTARYESSVLSTVLAVHRNSLREEGAAHVTVGLLGRTEYLRPNTLIAERLVHDGLQISSGDVVLNSGASDLQVGRVCACCLESSHLYVVVQVMTLVGILTQHSVAYTLPTDTSPLQVWASEALELACAWRVENDVLVVVRFRGYTSTWLWIPFKPGFPF